MSVAPLLEILAINALFATVLALLAASVSRLVRRPTVVHFLWLLVLARLLAPPVVELALLPAVGTGDLPVAATTLDAPAVLPVSIDALESSRARALPVASGVMLLWLGGALIVLATIGWRAIVFGLAVRRTAARSSDLERRVAALAGRLGAATAPRVRIVPARISPMIWGRTLLWPEGLTSRLETNEIDAVLAHELCHLNRRDHWVRALEIGAVVAFWWHPVMWWARRNLRNAEESACDAKVLENMPGRARAYARGLVKTLEFLAIRGARTPGMATGAMSSREMKKRLRMILDHDRNRRRPVPFLRVLGFLALGALLIAPTWAERDDAPDSDVRSATLEELVGLERQIGDLERQLEKLHARRAELRGSQRHERISEAELRERRLHRQQADRELALVREEQKLRQRELLMERELYELQQQELRAEDARVRGDQRQAREMAERARALEAELEHRRQRALGEDRERARDAARLDQMRDRASELREAGRLREARELDTEILVLEEALEEELGEALEKNGDRGGRMR